MVDIEEVILKPFNPSGKSYIIEDEQRRVFFHKWGFSLFKQETFFFLILGQHEELSLFYYGD